jgi:hypothetical protein
LSYADFYQVGFCYWFLYCFVRSEVIWIFGGFFVDGLFNFWWCSWVELLLLRLLVDLKFLSTPVGRYVGPDHHCCFIFIDFRW